VICKVCEAVCLDNVGGVPGLCNTCLLSGVKFDLGKPPMRHLGTFQGALGDVARVIEYGARKYSLSNWMKVHPDRYRDALLRHVLAYLRGEAKDQESGLPHLAHAICNCLFLEWFDNEKEA
jgi:hypothetical protein